VKLTTAVIASLLLGCLPPEPPQCLEGVTDPTSGACLLSDDDEELAFIQKTLALSGRAYPGASIQLSYSSQEVTDHYLEITGAEFRGTFYAGYNADHQILSLPTSLAHELVHSDISFRTGGAHCGSDHTPATHWTDEDTARKNFIKATAADLYPERWINRGDYQ